MPRRRSTLVPSLPGPGDTEAPLQDTLRLDCAVPTLSVSSGALHAGAILDVPVAADLAESSTTRQVYPREDDDSSSSFTYRYERPRPSRPGLHRPVLGQNGCSNELRATTLSAPRWEGSCGYPYGPWIYAEAQLTSTWTKQLLNEPRAPRLASAKTHDVIRLIAGPTRQPYIMAPEA